MGSKQVAMAVLAAVCASGSWAVADDVVVPMVWAPAGGSAGGDGDWDLVTPNFIEGTVPGPLTAWVNDGMRSATFNGTGDPRYLVHMQDVIVAKGGIVVNSPYTFIGLTGGAIDIGGGSITTGELAGVVPFAVPLTGAGGVTVSAATGSTVEFTEPNTYSGGTTVNAGTLRVAGGGTLGDPSGVLTVNGNVFPPASPPVFPPPGDGATVQVMSSQTVGGLAGTGGLVSLGDQVTLTVNQQIDGAFSGRVAGPGMLVKTGPGTLTTSVGAINSGEVSPDVSVAQGTLMTNQWLDANHVDIAAGAMLLTLSSNSSVKSLAGTGTLGIEGVVDITPAAADGFGGALAGTGAFDKRGPAPYALTGTFNFSGAVWSHGGPLTIGPGVQAELYGLSDGATLNVPAGGPLLIKPLGAIEARGSGGTSQHNTLVGSVDCQGYLRLFAQPATQANLTITGDLTFGAAAVPGGFEAGLAFKFDPAAGGVADELVVDGTLTIAGPVGVFPVSLVPGADVLESSYALIEYGSFDGLLNDPAGLYLEPSWASKFTLVNDPAQHTIFLVAVPEPGVLPVMMGGVGAAVMAGRRRRVLRRRA